MRRNTNDACIVECSRKLAKVFYIVCQEDALLLYCQLVDVRIPETAEVEDVSHMFDIKETIQAWKRCSW